MLPDGRLLEVMETEHYRQQLAMSAMQPTRIGRALRAPHRAGLLLQPALAFGAVRGMTVIRKMFIPPDAVMQIPLLKLVPTMLDFARGEQRREDAKRTEGHRLVYRFIFDFANSIFQ